ncbi:MAG: histidine kinase dimerization/phospho-acceptor domain-containing protein [Thermoanaerobaculia bacterium]
MERWLELYAQSAFRRYPDIHHDLKTPLNIAVLNLELLRMRVKRLLEAESDDPKVIEYVRSIDSELRRMAQIFDALFHDVAPPRNVEPPPIVDLGEVLRESFGVVSGPAPAVIHENRARSLFGFLAVGCGKIFRTPPRVVVETGAQTVVRFEGAPQEDGIDTARLFKLYYSDADGSPEISMATARMIADCYGGELEARPDGDNFKVELRLPSGDQ